MTAPLFLADVAGTQLGDIVLVTGEEGRHAAVVKRTRVGDTVLLADGAGHGVRGEVTEVDKAGISVRVDELLSAPVRAHRWVAVQALAKGDRSDVAIEAVTELGVDEVLAWQASRSIVRWDQGKAEKGVAKWQATVRESSKQARRLSVPVVTAVATSQVCERIRDAACAFVLHEDADQPLGARPLPRAGEVLFIVGPEGGICSQELDAFTQAGAVPVTVSDGVLRTSTAGVVALAQLQLLAAGALR